MKSVNTSINTSIISSLHTVVDSPVGPIHLYVDPVATADQPDGALIAILFDVEPGRGDMRTYFDADETVVNVKDHPIFERCASQLGEYFGGLRTTFDLPLRPAGTVFQRMAWAGLLTIPYGETRSYGQQAAQIDKPAAVRAIGSANGRNPLAIVVPCHRVIGANGSLTGFGGGLATKEWLLRHEGAIPVKQQGEATLF